MISFWYLTAILFWPISVNIFGFQLNLATITLLTTFSVIHIKYAFEHSISIKGLAIALAVIPVSIFIAVLGPCDSGHLKQIFSLPILLILPTYGYNLGKQSTPQDWLKLEKIAALALFLIFLTFLGEYFLPGVFSNQFSEGYRSEGRFTAFYSEPSYVAFSAFPSILILISSRSKINKGLGILAFIGLLIFSRSSTLVLLIFSYFLYLGCTQRSFNTSLKVIGFVFLISFAVYFLIPTQFSNAFSERFFGVLDGAADSNISSLVYLQGWQDALVNFQRTYGMGLGLNMMGCSPLPDVPARYFLSNRLSEALNSSDGSFLFSKITSEIGLIGILFCLFIFVKFIYLSRKIVSLPYTKDRRSLEIQLLIVLSFLSPLFVRGTGYFNGIVILFFISLPVLFDRRYIFHKHF